MKSIKVAGRNPISGKQIKRNVYKCRKDFEAFSPMLIERWKRYYDVEVREQFKNNIWLIIKKIPCDCQRKCDFTICSKHYTIGSKRICQNR